MKRQEILEAQADQRVVYHYRTPVQIIEAYAVTEWWPPRGHGSKVVPAGVERDCCGTRARRVTAGAGRWHIVRAVRSGGIYFVPSSALYPA